MTIELRLSPSPMPCFYVKEQAAKKPSIFHLTHPFPLTTTSGRYDLEKHHIIPLKKAPLTSKDIAAWLTQKNDPNPLEKDYTVLSEIMTKLSSWKKDLNALVNILSIKVPAKDEPTLATNQHFKVIKHILRLAKYTNKINTTDSENNFFKSFLVHANFTYGISKPIDQLFNIIINLMKLLKLFFLNRKLKHLEKEFIKNHRLCDEQTIDLIFKYFHNELEKVRIDSIHSIKTPFNKLSLWVIEHIPIIAYLLAQNSLLPRSNFIENYLKKGGQFENFAETFKNNTSLVSEWSYLQKIKGYYQSLKNWKKDLSSYSDGTANHFEIFLKQLQKCETIEEAQLLIKNSELKNQSPKTILEWKGQIHKPEFIKILKTHFEQTPSTISSTQLIQNILKKQQDFYNQRLQQAKEQVTQYFKRYQDKDFIDILKDLKKQGINLNKIPSFPQSKEEWNISLQDQVFQNQLSLQIVQFNEGKIFAVKMGAKVLLQKKISQEKNL